MIVRCPWRICLDGQHFSADLSPREQVAVVLKRSNQNGYLGQDKIKLVELAVARPCAPAFHPVTKCLWRYNGLEYSSSFYKLGHCELDIKHTL